jgi:hypothetical protein
MVLSEAGFGVSLPWHEDESPGPGHKLTFTAALRAQAETRLARRSKIPRLAAKLFNSTRLAYESDHEVKVRAL